MSESLEKITFGDKEIYLIKTAHVSKTSVEDVDKAIEEIRPDAICIELDKDRYETLKSKDKWRETDIVTIIKKKRVGLLLVNIILSSYQKRLAKKMDTTSGGEMLEGIKKAEELDVPLILADRNITTTFKRIWQSLGLFEKLKLIYTIVFSIFDDEEISEEELKHLKESDMLESALNEVGRTFPNVKRVLVDERDMYLSQKIKNAPGKKIVAIIGAAHSLGIKKYINEIGAFPPNTGMRQFLIHVYSASVLPQSFRRNNNQPIRHAISRLCTCSTCCIAGVSGAKLRFQRNNQFCGRLFRSTTRICKRHPRDKVV